jgi:hypothetical protein
MGGNTSYLLSSPLFFFIALDFCNSPFWYGV